MKYGKCHQCNGPFEFEEEQEGEIVTCPHCEEQTACLEDQGYETTNPVAQETSSNRVKPFFSAIAVGICNLIREIPNFMGQLVRIGLVLLALGLGIYGLTLLTQATLGVGMISFACLLGIIIRIAQASEHHQYWRRQARK